MEMKQHCWTLIEEQTGADKDLVLLFFSLVLIPAQSLNTRLNVRSKLIIRPLEPLLKC